MAISVTEAQTEYVVMGGTFDPVHYGHINTANALAQTLDYAYVDMMPCGDAYHKQGVLEARHRLAMLELALADEPKLKADSTEVLREGATYTVDTLRQLRQQLGADAHLCWIMGADAAAGLSQWKNWQTMFQLANVIVVNRGHDVLAMDVFQSWPAQHLSSTEHFKQQANGCFIQLALEPVVVSSTEIRQALHKQESVGRHVPRAVMNYIEQHGLYKGNN